MMRRVLLMMKAPAQLPKVSLDFRGVMLSLVFLY
jgi:hypothetical protein